MTGEPTGGAFDPFAAVDVRRGAPFGRPSSDPAARDPEARLIVQHQGGGDGYDRGGTYWGAPGDVFAVFVPDGSWCAYRRAASPEAAVAMVTNGSPVAT